MAATRRVVLASGNAGKLAELRALLAEFELDLVAQSELGVPEPEETGCTFLENALLKARHASDRTGLPAIADDSGLAVDALGGAPGIYSARYAGAGATDGDNVQRLLRELADVPDADRGAAFHCLLVFMNHAADPTPIVSDGVWRGSILREPRGTGGFGYDPIFLVPGEACSAAELEPAVKNRLSHRARALAGLRERFSAEGAG